MNKPMKALLSAVFTFTLSFTLLSQDLIFQMVTLTPKAGMTNELQKVMKEHNDTFHKDGPYGVRCYSINSGPDAGKIVWTMGPLTWGQLEDRPAGSDHEDHWDKKVAQYLEPGAHVEYYSFSRSLSHFPTDFTLDNLLIRYVDVKPGMMYRYNELIAKAREVYAAEMSDEPFGIYHNRLGNSKDGRDLMIVWFFDHMGWMGEDAGFMEKYNKVHGPGSFVNFRNDIADVVKGTDNILLTYMDNMGGLTSKVAAAERKPKK